MKLEMTNEPGWIRDFSRHQAKGVALVCGHPCKGRSLAVLAHFVSAIRRGDYSSPHQRDAAVLFLDEASHVLNRSVRSNYIKRSAPNDANKPAPPMIASPMKKRSTTSMAASVQK